MGRSLRVRVLTVGVAVAASVFVTLPTSPSAAVGSPAVRIGHATVVEGDAGSEVVRVPVDLSLSSPVKVTLQYAITAGTATSGVDFVARTGTLSFKPGAVHTNISVIVRGNTIVGPDKTVNVVLSNAVNATITEGVGTVTINDDDGGGGSTALRANIGAITVTRSQSGGHTAQIAVTLSRPAPSTIRLHSTMQCGYADGVALESSQSTITFLAGQQTKYLTFRVPADGNLAGAIHLLNTLTVLTGPVVIDQGASDSVILDPDPLVGIVDQQSVDSAGHGATFSSSGVCNGSGISRGGSLSADGRFVSFESSSNNLVPGDTNGLSDVFVHDNLTGTTERVSVATDGSQALYDRAGSSDNVAYSSISPSGRYVTFFSYRELRTGGDFASNVGGGFYLHDRQTGQTRVLVASSSSGFGAMSADDHYLVFESAEPLTPDDTDVAPNAGHTNAYGSQDVFRYDMLAGTFELVTKSYNGAGAFGRGPTISADGRHVGFLSTAADLVPGDTNACTDEFVRDMVTGVTQRVDVRSDGTPRAAAPYEVANGCNSWFDSVMVSANGRYAAFSSPAWNLVPGATTPPTSPTYDSFVYVRDLVSGTTEFIGPHTPIGAAPYTQSGLAMLTGISGDGQFVSYTALADASSIVTTYLYDRNTGDVSIVGQLPDGTIPNDDTFGVVAGYVVPNDISADGNYIVFQSMANNLVANDSNDSVDVFRQRIR